MKYIPVIIVSILVLVACSNGTEKKSASDEEYENNLPAGLKLLGDSIVLPSFQITIELTPKAERKLSNDNETIIVRAYLSGEPKDKVTSPLIDEMGLINLGESEVELKKQGTAKFENINVSREAFDLLKKKDFQILINVFSGRKSSDLNLLDCEILEESVTEVRAKKHTLKGKLIGE